MRKYGGLIYREKIEEIIEELDAQLLMDSDHFRDALEKEKEDFRLAPIREAAFAALALAFKSSIAFFMLTYSLLPYLLGFDK